MKIAVLGHGVVGSGVVEVLHKNQEGIAKKAGQPVEIKYILDRREFPELPYSDKFTKDFTIIRDDPEVKVVVEVMGGVEPAYTYACQCLSRGKSVVTSNKELVAQKGAALLELADENNVNFFFEASVGGGIPIIKPLHLCLGANEIVGVAGILNGTTNYILTQMIKEGKPFEDALLRAQALGYAERDPTADVEGLDACRKICILASLAFGSHIYPAWVHTEGITRVTKEDVAYADEWGGVIKLIGRTSKAADGRVSVMISPAFIHQESQLATVDDVFNAILVKGDATGDVVFYGKGAGKLPTASAVVSDIIDAVRANGTVRTLQWRDGSRENVVPFEEMPVKAYLRAGAEQAGQQIRALFGDVEYLDAQQPGETAFIADGLTEQELADKMKELERNGIPVLGMIRVLDL